MHAYYIDSRGMVPAVQKRQGGGAVQERVLSIHEASCVLISYLCELSSKARQQISHSEGVIESLVDKVLLMSDAEILHSASSAHTAGGGAGGATAPFGPDSPCLLYTSPSPRDRQKSRMPSSA